MTRRRASRGTRVAGAILAMLAGASAQATALAVVGDTVPAPLAAAGDATRGRALVVARQAANCAVCHVVPDPEVRFGGTLGPSLAGVGARFAPAQLRLRVADNLRVNPATLMPSYYKDDGFDRVAAPYAGKTILTAQEVEDVVAYLVTLR